MFLAIHVSDGNELESRIDGHFRSVFVAFDYWMHRIKMHKLTMAAEVRDQICILY